jgi:hypothetical protein
MYKFATLVVTSILNDYGRGHNVSLMSVSIVLIGIWILDQFAVFTHKSLIIPVNASQRANMRRLLSHGTLYYNSIWSFPSVK